VASSSREPAPASRAMTAAAEALAAMRARRSRGLFKGKVGREDRDEFVRAFEPALAAIGDRFGRVMDTARRVRTQPEEERLMKAASALLYDLTEGGRADGLFKEAAALGVLTFYVGDFKDALYWVNLAGRIDPDERNNKLNGAVLAAEFFDFELALRLVDEVLLASSDLKQAWALKGRAQVGMKLAEEALAAEVEKKGDLKRARELRKSAHARVEAAASSLREVVRIDPKDARAWYEFGKFLFTHGRLHDAAEAYGRAVALEQSMKLAWYQKGVCHQMLEEPGLALFAFEKGLALDRRDAGGIHFKIAAMQALLGKGDEAFVSIQNGLTINKPNFYSEIYRIELGPLWADPRWEGLLTSFFADTGFQHTKTAQAEVGFSWGLFDHGSVLFYDALADAFGAAEAYRRDGELEKAREFYEKLIALLDRERHPLKAAVVRGRLDSLQDTPGVPRNPPHPPS